MQVEVEIIGTSPMLQNRFSEEFGIEKGTRTIIQQRGTPREQADKIVYRDTENKFYFPGTWIVGSLRESASNHKLRGSRKSAKFIVPAAIRTLEVDIVVLNGDGSPIKNFEVDSRPVTIPATKGKIMKHRPRFDVWSAKFNLIINIEMLEESFVQQLITEAGQSQGIGDFRPNKCGPFGCFRVTSWKPIKKRER